MSITKKTYDAKGKNILSNIGGNRTSVITDLFSSIYSIKRKYNGGYDLQGKVKDGATFNNAATHPDVYITYLAHEDDGLHAVLTIENGGDNE